MIVIVGAGISGLALGWKLSIRGVPYTILEASDRVGGVIRTLRRDGRPLELGPQRLRSSSRLERLLPHLGPVRRLEGHPRVFIARGGELHPLPRTLGEAWRSSALSTRGKLRAALEPLMALLPDPEGQSAGAFLRRRVGREAYEVFLGPLFGGLYGSDPDRMEAGRTLRPGLDALGVRSFTARLLRGSRGPTAAGAGSGLLDRSILVPARGMEALPRALLEQQAGPVRLSTPVRSVEPAPGAASWVVRTPGGEGMSADAVVITTPAAPAGRMLESAAPRLGRALGSLRTNPLVLVHLDVPRLPEGLGFQVAFGEPLRMRGTTFSGRIDGAGRTAVVFMGGMADPGVVDAPEGELRETAAREFTRLTGIPARPIHLHRTAMPAWDTSWRALDGLAPPEGIHLLGAWSGRPGIIGRLREAERLAEVFQRAG